MRKASLLVLVDILAVAILAAFFCFVKLENASFGAGDQTTHSLVVQDMLHSGNLLHPTYKGKPYFNKPPLKMWISLVPLKIWGENNLSYRAVDASLGVLISILLFCFVRRVFDSRLAAFMSVLALLGADLFFHGHGVRNAVQDSLMHFFVVSVIMLGWRYFNSLPWNEPFPSAQTRTAAWMGVLLGLAAMCKGLGGYIALIVLFAYACLSGTLLRMLKEKKRDASIIFSLSLIPLGIFILMQGENADNMARMMFVSEGYKRAVRGFHHVRHQWFYWRGLVDHRLMVPPLLLLISSSYAIYRVLRFREMRLLFVLCWALTPLIFYQNIRSKLMWYILPALPGMAILVGVWISRVTDELLRLISLGRVASRREVLMGVISSLLLLFSGVELVGHLSKVHAKVTKDYTRDLTDVLTTQLRTIQNERPQALRGLLYELSRIGFHETLYWNMLRPEVIKSGEVTKLREQIQNREFDYVVTDLLTFEKLGIQDGLQAYAFLPPKYRRKVWLVFQSYQISASKLQMVSPRVREVQFSDPELELNYGWKRHAESIHGVKLRTALGSRAAIMLPADRAHHVFGTEVEFSLAGNVPAERGRIDVHVFLNDQEVQVFANLEQGFTKKRFFIPPGVWQSGNNQLSLITASPDGRRIDSKEEVLLVEKVLISVGGFPKEFLAENQTVAITSSPEARQVEESTEDSAAVETELEVEEADLEGTISE